MRINLVGGSYRDRYVAVNTKKVINWYLHKDSVEDENSKYKTAFMQFPGLSAYATLPVPILVTTTNGSTASGATNVVLTSVTGAVVGQTVYLTLTDATIFSSTITAINTGTKTITIAAATTGIMATGNQVVTSSSTASPARKVFIARTETANVGVYTNIERIFVVIKNWFIEITAANTFVVWGQMSSMNTADTTVYMEVNYGNQVMIGHSSASYIFNLVTNAVAEISDVDYPENITYLSYHSGYFFVCSNGLVYYSALNNGLSWAEADTFTPASTAAPTLALVPWRDELHCFTTESIELYINDGTTPFAKQPRSTIPIGLVAVDTLSVYDAGIFFLGRNRKGQAIPYFYDGVYCTPIAPMSTNWNINFQQEAIYGTWDTLNAVFWQDYNKIWDSSNIVPFTFTGVYADLQYSRNGNIFWYLTIPNLLNTFVFDVTTKEWVDRQSLNPTLGGQDVYRGKWFVNYNGINLVSDVYTGTIMREDITTVTELASPVTRTIISQIIANEKMNLSFNEFELETSAGVGLKATPTTKATIALTISRDGGNTFGNTVTLNTGSVSQFTKRARCHNLGTARDWVFSLVLTDQADITIQEAIVHGTTEAY